LHGQLTFDLPVRTALGRDAFFVSPANARAVARLDDWHNWPDGRIILVGPIGSGKSHLVHVWAADTGAQIIAATDLAVGAADKLAEHSFLVIEDVNQIAGIDDCETALFHLYNLVAAAGGKLLLTADSPPAHWEMILPDLKSRVLSMDLVALDAPDDGLLAALLVKLFKDRQISVGPDLIGYLVARMDRSAASAQVLVQALDALALAQKRPVTKRLAATVFQDDLK